MESTRSVRVNGLLQCLEFYEFKFFFFFRALFNFSEFCVDVTGRIFGKCFSQEISDGLFICYFFVCCREVI